MLTMPQILGSSARTVRSMATPRSAAPSLTLTRTVEPVPTEAASILSTSLLTLVMAVATGTPTPVVVVVVVTGTPVVVVVGKLGAFFFDAFDKTGTSLACSLIQCCEAAFTRPGISSNDG